MGALDLATAQTLAWLDQALPPSPARVLDVGCGAGHTAAGLLARGHEVVAIDPSEAAVAAARGRGVDARAAGFHDVSDETFDAVFFGRSLHHVPGLEDVHAQVDRLLAPGGRLVVEEWRWDGMDHATATWHRGLVGMAVAAGLLDAAEHPLDGDPLAAWMDGHRDHHIYTEADMLEGAPPRFRLTTVQRDAYLYRSFCRDLDDHPRGVDIATSVFDTETALVAQGALMPLALRYVAERA